MLWLGSGLELRTKINLPSVVVEMEAGMSCVPLCPEPVFEWSHFLKIAYEVNAYI